MCCIFVANRPKEKGRFLFEYTIYYNKKFAIMAIFLRFFGGGTGTRTLDPMIKSHLLYQLSYASKTELFSRFAENFAIKKTINQEKNKNLSKYIKIFILVVFGIWVIIKIKTILLKIADFCGFLRIVCNFYCKNVLKNIV